MTLEYYRDLIEGWCGSLKQSAADPLSRPVPVLLAGTAGTLGAWLLWTKWRNRNKRLPPSPRGWPLIGNLLDISDEDMHLDALRLQQRDGLPDIMTLRFGPSSNLIVLNSYAAIKDAFVTQGDLFAERPRILSFETMGLHDEIFLKPYADPTWNEGKMFIMSAMRSAGFGNSKSAEEKIMEQFGLLEQYLEPKVKNQDPIDICNVIKRVTSNIILNLLCNKAYDLDDAELLERMEAIEDWYSILKDLFIIDVLPALKNIFYRGLSKRAYNRTTEYKKFLMKEVEEHEATLDPENPRDFIDIYLSRKKGPVDKEHLVDTMFVLLPDGMDTVAALISWIILYVVSHPETMARIQKEVEAATGGSRHVAWADRPKLQYTEAAIMETIRVSCPVPLTAFHTPIRDCYYRGYFIPTDTPIVANLYAAMMDENNFKDPKKFSPERFLDEEGSIVKTDHWIPFSMGRRKCVGEQTSRIELILIVANMFQQYDISFAEENRNPSLEGKGALAKVPQPYKIILKNRH